MATANPFSKPKGKAGGTGVLNVDMTDVNEFGYMIPEGKYRARVLEVIQTESKTSGNPMLVWTFAITMGKYAKREFKHYTVLAGETKNSLSTLKSTLKALGLPNEGKLNLSFSSMINKECWMNIVEDSYQGKPNNKIKSLEPLIHGDNEPEEEPDQDPEDD